MTVLGKVIVVSLVLISSLESVGQSIAKIEFKYIPWSVKTRGALSSDDLIDEFNFSSYSITSDSLINLFENALNKENSIALNYDFDLDIRMVMLITQANGFKIKYALSGNSRCDGPDDFEKKNGCIYRNHKLNNLIMDLVPEDNTRRIKQ